MVISLPLQVARKEIKPGIIVLEIVGAIHMGPASQKIEQHVEQSLGRSENRMIFDLSKVTFVDSGGLGAIVRCFSKLKKAGGSLRLTGVKGSIATVMKITQVDKIIEVFPTPVEAAENFLPEGETGG
jgi:anti-sigma B factor antagonist